MSAPLHLFLCHHSPSLQRPRPPVVCRLFPTAFCLRTFAHALPSSWNALPPGRLSLVLQDPVQALLGSGDLARGWPPWMEGLVLSLPPSNKRCRVCVTEYSLSEAGTSSWSSLLWPRGAAVQGGCMSGGWAFLSAAQPHCGASLLISWQPGVGLLHLLHGGLCHHTQLLHQDGH